MGGGYLERWSVLSASENEEKDLTSGTSVALGGSLDEQSSHESTPPVQTVLKKNSHTFEPPTVETPVDQESEVENQHSEPNGESCTSLMEVLPAPPDFQEETEDKAMEALNDKTIEIHVPLQATRPAHVTRSASGARKRTTAITTSGLTWQPKDIAELRQDQDLSNIDYGKVKGFWEQQEDITQEIPTSPPRVSTRSSTRKKTTEAKKTTKKKTTTSKAKK